MLAHLAMQQHPNDVDPDRENQQGPDQVRPTAEAGRDSDSPVVTGEAPNAVRRPTQKRVGNEANDDV